MTTLLVASTGGHLKEMDLLHARFAGVQRPFRWVTFDTPQSRSTTPAETDFVRFVGGRDPVGVARNLVPARRIIRDHDVQEIVSTGSAVALSFFAVGRARGIPCHFIESAARATGPSTTGKLMTRVPGVRLYNQYGSWGQERWRHGGSVFDAFEPAPPVAPAPPIRRAVVSLGTYRGFSFIRLVERLMVLLADVEEVLWQTGDTDVSHLGITGHDTVPEPELVQAMREADCVIAHAGVGTALTVFELGKLPVLVPRRFAKGEHVDDHQIQVAAELGRRGLSVTVDADELTADHLAAAASGRVVPAAAVPPFTLAT